MAINVGARSGSEVERLLSNFAETPFTLNGQRYASVEGFWQSLKFTAQEDRERVGLLSGYEAKKAGREAPESDTFWYLYGDGITREVKVGSPEHHQLMEAALRAKFRHNPKVLKLLLQTGEEEITHIVYNKEGKQLPDSKAIPGHVFAGMLMDLRNRYRAIHGDGENILITEP